jgi:hypothetical protein
LVNVVSSVDGVTNDGLNIDLVATGTNITITPDNGAPKNISFDIVEGTLAGDGLVPDGDSLDVGPGSGISVGTDSISLGALTADWNQTGAFDILLNNASSELGIREDGGGTDYGFFNVLSVTGNTTYDFPNPGDGGDVVCLRDLANCAGAGDISAVGNVLSGSAFTGADSSVDKGNNLVFEGSTTVDDAFDLTLTSASISGSSKTITLPDNTGTVLLLQPAAVQAAGGAQSLIHLNETNGGTPNLIEIEVGGTDEFVVGNSGIITSSSVDSASVVDNSLAASDLLVDVVSSVDGVINDGGNIDLVATGTNITITPDNGAPKNITFDIVESVLAGDGLDVTGSSIRVGSGSGISVGTDSIALGPLTADWDQTGAFDILLNNASSELGIRENGGGADYGFFNVNALANGNTIYNFPDPGDGSDTVCLFELNNCAGAGDISAVGNVLSGSAFTGLTC